MKSEFKGKGESGAADKFLYCLGIVANEKPWYTYGMAGLSSPREE